MALFLHCHNSVHQGFIFIFFYHDLKCPDRRSISDTRDLIHIFQIECLIHTELLRLDQDIAHLAVLQRVRPEHIVVGTFRDMENRLLVLLRDKGTDIYPDDTLTFFTDDGNREIMEKTSVNIMNSVYHDRAKDNRNATGSGHRFYDGAATELMTLCRCQGRSPRQPEEFSALQTF